jgi:hypothetical protein
MSASQRVSRGFHRLGLFLAAIPLVIGAALSIGSGLSEADGAQRQHEKLLCANRGVQQWDKEILNGHPFWKDTPDETRLQLKDSGCPSWTGDTVSFAEARNPPEFNWLSTLAEETASPLLLTLFIALLIYGLVTAISWVIGGFAAS